jgi:glycosidase
MMELPSEKVLWWQTGVIYQVYPRSFKDSNGDGVGDLAGIIEKLDYLSGTLGVDAIWLSPFYPSPMADFGYDVADYTAVDAIFGDLATFDRLVAEAHRRDLRIIIDLVPNHTSDQHPWFLESRASRQNPKRAWYIWREARPDGGPPNNWLSVFGGSAWEWDAHTGQYYLHSFLKEQPDLNWRNPAVKEAMFGVARFWLERGVDGFRIDVAHFIMKDPDLRDNPHREQAGWAFHKSLGDYDAQLHLYDKGHPDAHQVYREFRQLLEEYSRERSRVSIGEIHIFEWEDWVRYYGEQLDELHLPFNFTLLGVAWQAQAVRPLVDSLEAILPPGAWPNYVFGNHDETRLASRIGPGPARVAAMLLLSLRGTPTIYYGDEIGMQNVPIPPEREQDPWGKRVPGLGRDPARTPMQWDAGLHAGFAPAEARELWLPLHPDYPEVNVAAELRRPDSMLNLYRSLLALRREYPALQMGEYQPIETPPPVFAYLRAMPTGQRLFAALNFSSQPIQLNLPGFETGQLLLSTYLDRQGTIDLAHCQLRGDEGLIVELPPA